MAWITRTEGPRRGVRYRVHWRDPSGRHRSKTFRRKADAEDFQRRTELDLSIGAWRDPNDARVLLREQVAAWLRGAANIRQSTRDRYEQVARLHVVPRWGDVPIGAIRTRDIRSWLADLGAVGVGARTRQQARQVLGLALEPAVRDGVLPINPVRSAEQPSAPRRELVIPTTAEVRTIADVVEPRFRAMVLLAAFGGLRFGELAGLQRRDLRLLERRVEVHRQVVETSRGVAVTELKTRASRRSVPIPGFVAHALGEHLGRYSTSEADDAHVFTTEPRRRRRGKAKETALLRSRNFRDRVWLPALERAKRSGIRFHDLRHHAASAMIAENANPKAVQERLGHSSIVVTLDRYGHLFPALEGDLEDRLEARYRKAEREAAEVERGADVLAMPTPQG